MGVDNIREAVKAVLDGGQLGVVSATYGVDKGALSRLVKGARIGLELAGVGGIDNGQVCESCNKLTAQLERLSDSSVDNTNVTEGISVDITEMHKENTLLRAELADLKLAGDTMKKLEAADLTPTQLRSVIEYCGKCEVELVDMIRRPLVWSASIRYEREERKKLWDRFERLRQAKGIDIFGL